MKTQITDGGRKAAGFGREANDCQIRALACATGLPYALVHDIAKKQGRRNGGLFDTERVIEGMSHLPFEFQSFEQEPIELETFLRESPEGEYITRVNYGWSQHVRAIVDGIPHDTKLNMPDNGEQVIKIWRVIRKEP